MLVKGSDKILVYNIYERYKGYRTNNFLVYRDFSFFPFKFNPFFLTYIFLCYQIGTLPSSACETDETYSPVLEKAKQILYQLGKKEISTTYDHTNVINSKKYSCNCYGLINHLVKETKPEAFEDLLTHMETLNSKGITSSFEPNQPSPFNFYHIFKNLYEDTLQSTHWQGIENVSALIPGDLLVYGPPTFPSLPTWNPQDRENMKDGNQATGSHIMIVSSIEEITVQFVRLRIIDSSYQAHHTGDDTRYALGILSGVGEATLLIKKIEGQATYTLKWGNGQKSREYTKEVFAGRLIPLNKSRL